MAPAKLTPGLTTTTAKNSPMVSAIYGWTPSPDDRGTWDILLSCLVTIFLCSWSVLFLNVPPSDTGPLGFALNKLRWMAFTILFPEMVTGIAAEQWRSAIQSVGTFSELKEEWETAAQGAKTPEKWALQQENLTQLINNPWTIRHSFFADMGGFLLECPDFPAFPIDGFQLAWLLKNDYLEYLSISKDEIWDKNKADGFARTLTICQIAWFSIQCFGRWAQHLALATFELSTLAFILCSLNTFFFWSQKPLDVETPINLKCNTKMVDIITSVGDQVIKRYVSTPLDFVKPRTSRASLITPFWVAMELTFGWKSSAKVWPIKSFKIHQITPPLGIKIPDIIFALVFTNGYFGIHLIAWNWIFPTHIERIIWRTACLTLLGLLALYLFGVAAGTTGGGWFAKRYLGNDKATTIPEFAALLPKWAAMMLYVPVISLFIVARSYIIIEGFVSLRTMPKSAFASVNWWKFVPHY